MKNKQFNIILLNDSEFTNGTIKLSNFEYPLFLPENILINYTKIENITTDENYFLLIYHYDSISSNTELINGFNENVKNAISNNNLKVIYFSPHESPPSLIEVIKILTNTIKTNNWKETQFYIINNNSNLSNIKEKFNSNINFYKMNCLLRVVSNMIKPLISEKDIHFDKKFIFLCLNRNPTANHRIALLSYLKHSKLLENDITDWSWVCPYSISSKNIQSIQHLKKYINPTNKSLIKNYLEICNEKKLSYYEQNINWFDVKRYDWSPTHNIIDTFKNSYINIVTETAFDFVENDLPITEKSFRPFYYFQIPIFLARPGHVKALKEEYDFYFFDDIIDHSYDSEIDDVKRFKMILSEIQRLSNMREEISIYYKNNVDKLIHNHNFIKTYSNKKIEETYFLNLINENK
jgi:hypothetical protein